MICRQTLIIVMSITASLAVAGASAAADVRAGAEIADEQCNACHVAPGEMVGLGQAPELGLVVPVVDWTHLRMREWFATGHPIRLSFQVTDRDLHDLRFYLMDLHDQSLLGTLGQP
jgi:mono/diheme cytochrome c family protein